MKTKMFYGIIMLFAAFFITSCGPKTPADVTLGDGNLNAYAQLDKATNTFLWGIRTAKSGQPKIKTVFMAVPTAIDEYFIGSTKDGQIIFDNQGIILATGTSCSIETSTADVNVKYISIITEKGQSAYLLKDKKLVGPKPDIMVGATQVFYQDTDSCGILNYDNKDVIPTGTTELYVVIESKVQGSGKNKTTVETMYYLANDGKIWNIYKTDGSKVKKMPPTQLKKFQKDAVTSPLEKISYTKVPAI